MNNNNRVAIYARVSTSDKGQDPNLQINPLREYCKARGWVDVTEYVDLGISGVKAKRPQLDRLLDDARKRKIDIICVWKLDRFGRSLKHLVNTLEELQGLKVSFVSYMESLDFTSATGKLMFNILASFSQFERDIISDRVRAGIANVRSRNKNIVIGRKPLPPIVKDSVRELRGQGLSIRAIAKKLKLSVGAVHKTLSNSVQENGYIA